MDFQKYIIKDIVKLVARHNMNERIKVEVELQEKFNSDMDKWGKKPNLAIFWKMH